VYLRRWNGSAWVEFPAGSASGDGLGDVVWNTPIALVADSGGDPWVGWISGSSYAFYVKHWDGAAWVEVGGSATGDGISGTTPVDSPRLTIREDGSPAGFWAANDAILARGFDGLAWTAFGTGSDTEPGIVDTCAFIDFDVLPNMNLGTVLATTSNCRLNIELRLNSGGEWQPLPGNIAGKGISETNSYASDPWLFLEPSGTPVVFWLDDRSGVSQLYAKRHGAAGWSAFSEGSASDNGISNAVVAARSPVVLTDPLGRYVVAWLTNPSGALHVYLKRFDGVAWQELGGSASGTGVDGESSSVGGYNVGIGPDNNPVVTWSHSSGNQGDALAVSWFHDDTWTRLPTPFDTDNRWAISPASASATDALGRLVVVALLESRLRFAAWDGTVWQQLPDMWSESSFDAVNPWGWSRIHLKRSERYGLIAVWEDGISGVLDLHARAFDGTAWRWLSGANTSFGNISRSAVDSYGPSLALDEHGRPWVAWSEVVGVEQSEEVYLRRFNGDDWVEVLPGSASTSGVSNSRCPSFAPSLAIRDGQACVAWSECDNTGSQIVMRCTEWTP